MDVNPNCEIVVATTEFAWLRIARKVEFKDYLKLKHKIIDSNEFVIYETPENSLFEVFTITGKATILTFR